MSKRNNRNNSLNLNLNTIIKRLPLQQHLNDNHSALIKFSPTWQEWSKKNIAPHFLPLITLNSFENGLLIMRCTTPTAASQLKHLQVSLLDAFHAAKSNEIKRIKIQIDHTSQETIESKRHSAQEVKKGAPNYKPLKPDTIENIQNCKSSVKSEKLSHSLDKLAATLADTHKLNANKTNNK